MTKERMMEFVERTLECRKLFPDVSVSFHIESTSEELYVSAENGVFFHFSTHDLTKTRIDTDVMQFRDPDLLMGELFLNNIMMRSVTEATERATKDAETICRTSASKAG